MRRLAFLCVVFFSHFIQADTDLDKHESLYQYALSVDHPLRSKLDSLFSSLKTLQTQENFEKKGFVILHRRPSTLIIAKHAALPGYLIKVYLESSSRPKEENLENLVNRCRGAENIRNLIRQERLRYFTVPDKWIYTTPVGEIPVLLVTDMDIVSKEQSKQAWKNLSSKRQLEELYCIISHGYASTYLPANIPYTRSGKFSCIDTEQPQREPRYENVKAHISKKMSLYWTDLVNIGSGL